MASSRSRALCRRRELRRQLVVHAHTDLASFGTDERAAFKQLLLKFLPEGLVEEDILLSVFEGSVIVNVIILLSEATAAQSTLNTLANTAQAANVTAAIGLPSA